MSGNKVNTKTKGKDDKGKTNKSVTQSNEDGEDLDFAVLRKPIPTSITGFAQARKIFDLATEELKELLSNECDLLYECKVCRNIFRSLANFISHKRVYCKEKFNSSLHGHFIKCTSTASEILQIRRTEEEYKESLKPKNETSTDENDENYDRIPLTKDLTAIYEKIIKSKGVLHNDQPQVLLKKIPSNNIAVFQSMIYDEKLDENMRAQVNELDHMLSCDKAVLQSDGKFTVESSKDSDKPDSENVIQISDDDENEETDILKCKICDLQFSTQKTLKFHMKYKHLESRLVYPCPDCLEIFSTSWSVYRHLFKVHRKTAAQIRRLRESIQSKAFRMNNPPAFYEKRKNNMKPAPTQKISEEERLDQENQAWMDNMEGDGEVPRCGGCGRTFERRAALSAHTHTCQPRSRALARRPDAKRIEIQIRKDYNKGPAMSILKAADPTDNKALNDESQITAKAEEDNVPEADDKDLDEAPPMDIDEDEQKSNESADSPEKLNDETLHDNVKPIIRLPFALQAEKSNLAAFKQRINVWIDFSKLQCKKCNSKLSTVLELYEHMADHVKWMRYACKLCNFKHYNFEKLPEHVKVVHKLRGDSDFYYSTVKAIDGTEAMIISKCLEDSDAVEETNETNETSPESRRPSSDSSRLSDDSSSSSTFTKDTSSGKRKLYQSKGAAKRKKVAVTNDEREDQKDGETMVQKAVKAIINDNSNSSNLKTFEENSSDMDDIEEKITKRHDTPSVVSRRPVRKRTKPKNEDFEYDLSNLLKMEAQGYRDSQTVTTTKTTYNKKKPPTEVQNNFEIINKDCCGALFALSKKAVNIASAHMRTSNFAVYSTRDVRPNIFVRPTIPRILSRGDKMSPKKDLIEDQKDNKLPKSEEPSKEFDQNEKDCVISIKKVVDKTPEKDDRKADKNEMNKSFGQNVKSLIVKDVKILNNADASSNDKQGAETSTKNADDSFAVEQNGTENTEQNKSNASIPAVVPIKFRRQSLELMKNPIINKNITDFSKAGMKTKILVIKPINRNNDGLRQVNTPLKFQTIKLKDPSKGSSSEDKSTDQVMVVKVPKVPCTVAEKIASSINNSAASLNTNSREVSSKNGDDEKNISCKEDNIEEFTNIDENKQTTIGETILVNKSVGETQTSSEIVIANTPNAVESKNDIGEHSAVVDATTSSKYCVDRQVI